MARSLRCEAFRKRSGHGTLAELGSLAERGENTYSVLSAAARKSEWMGGREFDASVRVVACFAEKTLGEERSVEEVPACRRWREEQEARNGVRFRSGNETRNFADRGRKERRISGHG